MFTELHYVLVLNWFFRLFGMFLVVDNGKRLFGLVSIVCEMFQTQSDLVFDSFKVVVG